MVHPQDHPASQRREEVGKLQEDRSKAVIAKTIEEATKAVEKASTEAQGCTAEVREGSDGTLSSRLSSTIGQFEKSTEANSQYTAEGGRVIEDVKANMLQGIMHSSSESESDDDDEEGDEDEAKKPATSDKPKRSLRDKERRKNRRKLESKLKDELSIVSTATEVQGQEMMMIMKHVNLIFQGDREVPRQGRSEQGEDRENTTAVRCETPHRGKLQPVPKHPRTDAVVQQGKQMVWPSGGNNYREHRFNRSCHREQGSRGREHQLGVETFQFEMSILPKGIAKNCSRKSTHGT